jgi:hypothetical protein
MSTRQTSIDCYNKIKSEGLLSKLRLATYGALINSAPCTAGELQEYIEKNQIKVKHSWKLLSQLRDLGVVYETKERQCKVSGRTVIEWDLTNNLPNKEKITSDTKKERLKNALDALRNLYKKRNSAIDDDWKNVANLIKKI